jgi:sec-independent protein translocase protein TatC
MLVYFLTRIGIITPDTMQNSRKIAYIVILFILAVITPQGDMFSLILVSLPIILLYELSILVSKRIHKNVVKELA